VHTHFRLAAVCAQQTRLQLADREADCFTCIIHCIDSEPMWSYIPAWKCEGTGWIFVDTSIVNEPLGNAHMSESSSLLRGSSGGKVW